MTELKPCPFCGGEAQVHSTYDMDTNEVDGYFAICRNKECTAWPETAEYLTEAEAIAAWNTRYERTTTMTTDPGSQHWYSCDACDADGYAATVPNYCPNCGAKVVGE